MGQVQAVLAERAPESPAITLFADLPVFNPRAAAYLLPAYMRGFGDQAIFLCVVDPGVGGGRDILLLRSRWGWFIAPDNGLLAVMVKRAGVDASLWRLTWQPDDASFSFHGRDVMAPVAAIIANGQFPPAEAMMASAMVGRDWPDDLAEVVYLDHYGNAVTGLRAEMVASDAVLRVGGRALSRARTFSERSPGGAFWYANANGLVEIAVNQGRADEKLGLSVGSAFNVA